METSYSKSQIVGLVVSFLVGLALIYYSVDLSINAIKTKKWTTTIGTIISSEIKSTSMSKGGTGYIPKIYYSYKVGAQVYSSTKIRSIPYGRSKTTTTAERIIKKYPVNSNVTVYYNPNELKDSVLEPGIKFANILVLLLGLALFLPPIIAYFYSHKKQS